MAIAISARALVVDTDAALRARTSDAIRYPIDAAITGVMAAAPPITTSLMPFPCFGHQIATALQAAITVVPRPPAHHLDAAVAPASMTATLCGGPVKADWNPVPSVSSPNRFKSCSRAMIGGSRSTPCDTAPLGI